MKSINFINPVPPKKQRRLIFWFYGSLLIIVTALVILTYFLLFRMRQAHSLVESLSELKKNASLFDEYVAQKKELQKNKVVLEEQLNTLRSFNHHVELSHGLLATLATITPPTIRLSSIQGEPGKNIIIEGVALHAQAVTTFLQQLNNNQLMTGMKLAYVTPCEEKSPQGKPLLQFKFEGEWKFNNDINFED
jgi:Tfp pilus assembly protein PilN